MELAVSRVILEHADSVAEVNKGVGDGGNMHFARVDGSPSVQVPSMGKSFSSAFTVLWQGVAGVCGPGLGKVGEVAAVSRIGKSRGTDGLCPYFNLWQISPAPSFHMCSLELPLPTAATTPWF